MPGNYYLKPSFTHISDSMNEFLSYSVFVMVVLSGVPLFVSTVVGLLVTLLQSLFSLQEQTTVFAVRLLVIGGVFIVGGASGVTLMKSCLIKAFKQIALSGNQSQLWHQ
jgi:type III secretory pathway component EscS